MKLSLSSQGYHLCALFLLIGSFINDLELHLCRSHTFLLRFIPIIPYSFYAIVNIFKFMLKIVDFVYTELR